MAIFPFTPSTTSNFQFAPTLDGQVYTGIVTWNFEAQRWYLNIVSSQGQIVLTTAMVQSPAGLPLAAIVYVPGLVAPGSSGIVEATTQSPHGLTVGNTVALTIAGATPSGFNGTFDCWITGPSSFNYALTADPSAAATVAGTALYNIDLVGPLFSSTLVWREGTLNIEIQP